MVSIPGTSSSPPDGWLDPDAIRARLITRWIGHQVYAFDSIGSTNQVAWRLALEGYPEGTLVIAEEQRRGRGRLGRSWHSPKGLGLWFSVVLRPRGHARYAWLLPLAMSLPVSQALRQLYGLEAKVKWPNDVLVSGRKIAGVLVEGSVSSEKFQTAVVGIGINVNQLDDHFPPELRDRVTSVRRELGQAVSRLELLAQVLLEMERIYSQLVRDEDPVLEQWRRSCAHLGARVRVTGSFGKRQGIFLDVGSDGAILLRDSTGRTEGVHPVDLFLLEE